VGALNAIHRYNKIQEYIDFLFLKHPEFIMRYFSVLILGLLIGYYLGHLNQKPAPQPAQVTSQQPTILSDDQTIKPASVSRQQKQKTITATKSHEENIELQPTEKLSNEDPKIAQSTKASLKHQLSLRLNEANISLIEDNLFQIRESASTELSNRGWIIKLEGQSNYLSRLGFKNGDLVRLDILNDIKADPDPDRAQLAYRIESILRTLER
jgi:hypothetical protein